jgi:hypothetical protein
MAVIFPIVTSAQRAVLGVALSFSILAVTAVAFRLLAHQIARKKWTPSDYFIIAACVSRRSWNDKLYTGVVLTRTNLSTGIRRCPSIY